MAARTPMSSASATLVCSGCGTVHRAVSLGRTQRAHCTRCDRPLARRGRGGDGAALAFTVAGLIFAIPAITLPLVTVSRFGNHRDALFFSGVSALWRNGMELLAVWVAICGCLAPICLLSAVAALHGPVRWREAPALRHFAHMLEAWAMPEVQVLAMLVALVKLGSLVKVTIEAGAWCYAAMSLCTLLAWRSAEEMT